MPVLENARKSAAEQLVRALDIPALVGDALLAAVNSRRETLGLPHLAVLEANTSVKDGLTVTATAKGGSRVPRPQALADLKDVAGKLASIAGETFKASAKAAADAITEFRSDPASSDGISHEALLKSALNLFDDRACPVCDTPWEPAEFRRVIGEKLEHFHALTKRREEMERQLTPVTDELSALASALALVSKYGPQLTPPVDVKAAQDHGGLLTRTVTTIKNFLPLLDTERALTETDFLPSALSLTIEALEGAVNALPEPTQQDAARDFLTVAQERLDMYRETSRQLKAGQKKAETARKVLDHFGTVTTAALDKIYRDVEEFFSGLYRAINHEDEGAFRAQLKPSLGKLGFDVDFYGRGYFPPGAYHSEGHQDGMGLCLYLALMRHLQGEHFTFAVLDDVLMSVDAGHRREVSKMLGEKFPNTQFIMTTHDEIWLRHMKTAGLIGQNGFTHFRTWHVDSGPTEWDDRDVWQELDDYLKANDVRSAAALLRHYLEHISKEICQRVRARVEFRGDAQFVLGDLLPNAIGAFRGHLKSGKAAAQSWAQTDIFDALTASETQFAAAVTASNVEQWQINAAVHYNEWAALQKSDFEPVALAFKALVAQFQCVDCGTFLYVSPDRGQAEVMRCGCSKISINFGKRKN